MWFPWHHTFLVPITPLCLFLIVLPHGSPPPSMCRCWPGFYPWSLVRPTFQILPVRPIHSHCFHFYLCSDNTQVYISRPELYSKSDKSCRCLNLNTSKTNLSISSSNLFLFFFNIVSTDDVTQSPPHQKHESLFFFFSFLAPLWHMEFPGHNQIQAAVEIWAAAARTPHP